MRNTKYEKGVTILKSNRKITETEDKSMPLALGFFGWRPCSSIFIFVCYNVAVFFSSRVQWNQCWQCLWIVQSGLSCLDCPVWIVLSGLSCLDCPVWIAPSVFSYAYLHIYMSAHLPGVLGTRISIKSGEIYLVIFAPNLPY